MKLSNEELENKINELVEKIEKEDSKIKRLYYIVNCKMLVNKLERQINLQFEKEKFEKAKKDNKITAREEKVSARSRIIVINKNIKEMEKAIKENKEYDFESSEFLFPKKDIEQSGGIKEYTETLEQSGQPEQVECAQKINQTIAMKKELEKYKSQLREEKENLDNADLALKSKNNKIGRQKMLVEVKGSRFNIFARIRNLATSITYGVKEFWEEGKESRKTDKDRIKDFDSLKDAYNEAQEKIRQEYERKMEALDEKRKEISEKRNDSWEEKNKENKESRKSKQALKFQEQLKNIKNPTNDKEDTTSEIVNHVKDIINGSEQQENEECEEYEEEEDVIE